MPNKVPITVAHGDGIGPEIMDATLTILKEAGNRGVCTDSFRCHFTADKGSVTQTQLLGVLKRLTAANLDIVQTVSLTNFDGKAGFTLAQGQ